MELSLLVQVASSILMFGIFYGMTNARLKNLEQRILNHDEQGERLTRVEEKLNLLIQHFLK